MNKAKDAQQATPVTREAHFHQISPEPGPGSQLLAVRPGIDAVTALEHAFCVLDCVRDQLADKVAASEHASVRDMALWQYALEQSLAVLESAIGGITDTDRSPNAAEGS